METLFIVICGFVFTVLFVVGACKLAYKLSTTLDGQVHEKVRAVTQEERQFFRDKYVISGGRIGSPKYEAQINEWCKNLACIDGVIINKKKEVFYDPSYDSEYTFTIRFIDGIECKEGSIIGLSYDKEGCIEEGQSIIGYCVADAKGIYHLMGIALK